MALDTALPALADTLALYLPTYVSNLGYVYDRSGTDPTTGKAYLPTPDSVGHTGGDKTHLIFLAPYTGVFDTDGSEGLWPTAGSGGMFTDEDTVQVVCLHGTGANVKLGTLQAWGRPYAHAVRAVIRAHNRLGLGNSDLWRARAKGYKFGRFEWGGEQWAATQVDVVIAYEEQLTPAN